MAPSTRKVVGNRIRILRKANKLSQEKLALMVSVERSHLSKIECGVRNCTIDSLEKIANGLGIKLSELLDGAEEEGLLKYADLNGDQHPDAPEVRYYLTSL